MKIFLILIIPLLLGVACNKQVVFNSDIPDSVLSTTNQHIVEKVGQEEFNNNYKFSSDKSTKNEVGAAYDYDLYYEYKPASEALGQTKYLIAKIKDNRVEYMNGLYSCGKEICKISIDKEEALNIARQKGFFAEIGINNDLEQSTADEYYSVDLNHSFGNFDYWTWTISGGGVPNYDTDPDCGEELKVEIHAGTGEATDLQRETWCF